MPNTLNKQLAFISLDLFSRGGLRFYFLCPSYVWLQGQINPYYSSWLYNIQSKIKINDLLSNSCTLKGQNHREFPLSVLLYIGTAKGLQF